MAIFKFSPSELQKASGEIHEHAASFRDNAKKIFDTVEKMRASDYLSPEAMVLAEKIESYKEDIEKMAKKFDEYSEFLHNSVNVVESTQDELSARFK